MFTWKDYHVEERRREEERHEANRQRLIKAAMSSRESAIFHVKLAIGKRLVAMGTRMQERCREMAAIYPELTKELLEGRTSSL